MRDHDLRLRRNSLAPFPCLQITNKSARCTIDVEKIHRVRADARELRSLAVARIPTFRSRDDFPDGAAPQATGAEGECLVKPVVQFLPLTAMNEFVNRPE